MSLEVSNSFKYMRGGPLDENYGPYDTLSAANAAIPNTADGDGISFRKDKVVKIGNSEYWWVTPYADVNLVKKTSLPEGGLAGNTLIKASDDDFDLEYFDFDTLYAKLTGVITNQHEAAEVGKNFWISGNGRIDGAFYTGGQYTPAGHIVFPYTSELKFADSANSSFVRMFSPGGADEVWFSGSGGMLRFNFASGVTLYDYFNEKYFLKQGDVYSNYDSDLRYVQTSTANSALGYAKLDSGGYLPTSIIPDALFRSDNFKGTYNGTVITSDDPALNGNPLPTAALGNKGYYLIATASFMNGGKDYNTGDWIISLGSAGWDKVDNTDAVSTVFGRPGNVVANTGDYTAAQVTNAVSTIGSYSNPSWITDFAYSKITGVPTFALDADVVHKTGSITETITGLKTFTSDFAATGKAAFGTGATGSTPFSFTESNSSSTGGVLVVKNLSLTGYSSIGFAYSNGAGGLNIGHANSGTPTGDVDYISTSSNLRLEYSGAERFRVTSTQVSMPTGGFSVTNGAYDATNYERVRQYWSSNIYNIASEKGGTGVVRAIKLNVDNTVNFQLTNSVINYQTYGVGAGMVFSRYSGTFAAPTQVLSGQQIGGLYFNGYTSSGALGANVGAFQFLAAEDFTSTAQGTAFDISTTPIGSTTRVSRFSISNSGNVNISNLTASRVTITDGSKNLASSAVTSTELALLAGKITLATLGSNAFSGTQSNTGTIANTGLLSNTGQVSVYGGNLISVFSATEIGNPSTSLSNSGLKAALTNDGTHNYTSYGYQKITQDISSVVREITIPLLQGVMTIMTTTGAPSSSTDPGIPGEKRSVGGYNYECIAVNTWIKYAVITSF